jgi:hypothetical protein
LVEDDDNAGGDDIILSLFSSSEYYYGAVALQSHPTRRINVDAPFETALGVLLYLEEKEEEKTTRIV